jgi:broad specificity phosphatase PhoE
VTTVFLVRHAAHDSLGLLLVGRNPVRLNEEGRGQAERVAGHLAHEGIDVIQSSPRERARETAAPIALRCGAALEIVPGLDEIDFGEWTGRPFASLDGDPGWCVWNTRRGEARPPRGETMRELQTRVVAHVEAMRLAMPHSRIAMVSHAETIRAAALHYLGIPLDGFAGVDLAPASITTIVLGEWHRDVLALNQTVAA